LINTLSLYPKVKKGKGEKANSHLFLTNALLLNYHVAVAAVIVGSVVGAAGLVGLRVKV
jgi:hypothetical protein